MLAVRRNSCSAGEDRRELQSRRRKPIWVVDGPTEQFVASPSSTATCSSSPPAFRLPQHGHSPDGTGNVTKTHVAWHENKTIARKAAYVPSPIAFDKWFFVISDDGYLNCLDAENRQSPVDRTARQSSQRVAGSGDGYLYLPADDGTTYSSRRGQRSRSSRRIRSARVVTVRRQCRMGRSSCGQSSGVLHRQELTAAVRTDVQIRPRRFSVGTRTDLTIRPTASTVALRRGAPDCGDAAGLSPRFLFHCLGKCHTGRSGGNWPL